MEVKKVSIYKKKLTGNVAIPVKELKILKQASLDRDETMGKILAELIEDNLR